MGMLGFGRHNMDAFGAPGTKDVDIEDLAVKANERLSRSIAKPTEQDAVRLQPFVMELVGMVEARREALPRDALSGLKRRHGVNHKSAFLLQAYHVLVDKGLVDATDHTDRLVRSTLLTKAVKSWSGVTNVTLFTAPFPTYTDGAGNRVTQWFSCPFDCHYCPKQPDMPRSYLINEPAVLRAAKNGFDCVAQVHDRMEALYAIGHGCLKIELNVLGGTFAAYPNEYREEFVRDAYYAVNTFWEDRGRPRLSLQDEKEANTRATSRVVLLAVEIRPDSVTRDELVFLRRLSVTRVQLGIQHTDDEVLHKINRKCTTKRAIQAIEDLKRHGFKVDAHFMPNLPFSSAEKDRNMLMGMLGIESVKYRRVGANEEWEEFVLAAPGLQADQLKIYPTAVTVFTEIESWYRQGIYVPYPEEELVDVLLGFKAQVFPWIRINRIMRDFFVENVLSKSGSNTSLRSSLASMLESEGKVCRCIRCREAKTLGLENGANIKTVVRSYNASNGTEFFISIEDDSPMQVLYGFARLRLDDAYNKVFMSLNNAALLRELHVYSCETELGKKGKVQHRGLGSMLMAKAEEIALKRGYCKMAVIASVGSRTFYQRLGYVLDDKDDGEYMTKRLGA